ncbi:uncharacterized protein QC763_703660 [Podospora pseudopauciseta]|uniref:NACHT domain-containing protein n=1 Tax=Podospora pseudopauciseta TaxID=2093780 RepID=A0ABR0GZS9_9PEZI|nr:hypothetical protein QC763_703660 [Podospora pseudopauciseta]
MALDKIQAQSFTILHPAQGETSNGSPVADIILVHGLQGHSKRTWLYTSRTQDQRRDSSSRKRWKGALGELMSPKSGSSASVGNAGPSVTPSSVDDGVYWPGDLLPPDCPNARIMVWGYDTVISKGYAPTDKSSLFGHAKNLLYALNRIRPQDRKIVFVAHSLGGLIVKEMLRRSQPDEDSHIQNIIQSTAAVIFLGTPHRGSHEFARLGDMVRKVASTILRVDSNETIIRALGLDSPELELSRESFLQWRTYGFLVKTFQESQALSGAPLGLLNGKVLGEIQRGINSASVKSNLNISEEEKECLGSLYYEAMFSRQRTIKNAIPKTCEWFYRSSVFQTWSSRKRASTDLGLLWLKGKPGAGKSTVMKYALAQLECVEGSRSNVASFYFNARGNAMEKSPLGLLRSVLHQLCLQDCQILATFSQTYQRRQSCDGGSYLPWSELELESFFEKVFKESSTRRTFIFIDALDECSKESVREAVYFIDGLHKPHWKAKHYPAIRTPNCPEVVVEAHNDSDISTYIRDKLRFIPASESNEAHAIQAFLEEMASGVFLWVVLVVELVVRDINSGQPISKVAKRVKGVPKDMEDLYHQLFRSLTPYELTFSVPLIQRVLLHKDYLPRTGNDAPPKIPRTRADGGIRFLHLAVRLSSISGAPTRQNLSDWGYIHPAAPPPTDRILRLINSTSRGLIEYTADGRVQFVHETVREFFLTGPGFGLLDSSLQQNPLGRGYMALVTGCLNALDLPEHSELTTTVKIIHLHTLWALDD